MYIILVYDVNVKRTAKMLKLCRRYLNWIQNSVFEGEISESKLDELKKLASKILIEEDGDSLILFKSRNERWLEKEIVGHEKNKLDNMI